MLSNHPNILGRSPTAASMGIGDVDGPSSSTDNAVVRFNGTTGKIIQNSTVIMSDNGDISMPSTATAGIQLYDTVDQVTNYERLELVWQSDICRIRTVRGGSGSARALEFTTAGGNELNIQSTASTSTGWFRFVSPSTSLASALNVLLTSTFIQTSGTNVGGLSISPTYNQASGTAANTDLKITRTQTAIGSGAQYLIQAGTAAAVSLFTVSNLGFGTFGGVTPTLTTSLHVPASTTGVSSIRLPHGSAPSSPVDGDMWTTTAGLFVRINGSTVGPLS